MFRPPPQHAGGYTGSKRQTQANEWIDDRVIDFTRVTPTEDAPPEPQQRAAPPSSYDPAKVYAITLGTPAMFAGRMLTPGKQHHMVGYVCTEIAASIIDAVEIGDDPNASAPAREREEPKSERRGWRG